MTAERFLRILEEPDQLASISYEELKTLALAYPYAHNLRQLLLLKSVQTDHPEQAENLANAAANSLDRCRLFALVTPAPVHISEPVLELRPIAEMQHLLELKIPLPQTETADNEAIKVLEAPIAATELIPPTLEIEIPSTPEVPIPQPEIQVPNPVQFGSWVAQFNLPTLATNTPIPTPLVVVPIVPTVVPPPPAEEEELEDLAAEPPPKVPPTPRQPTIAQVLAEKSVAEKEEVMSETLAKIYAMQGHKEKAILMYERLSLAIPEKSTFFAALIAQLKK